MANNSHVVSQENVRQTVVYPYQEMGLVQQWKGIIGICNHWMNLWGIIPSEKKLGLKLYILYESIYRIFLK